ncbi:TIGR01459 family HAD-type hydrolase [Consotaella aegiceratis]|uniref:TIGR01459 family HAD-type hydrolase n=1 Tax=Consotaella aegiceratis TaxID=3097961 RepID=UPI002F412D46
MTSQIAPLQPIATLDEAMDGYDGVFCDVWGVVHNGRAKFEAAEAALQGVREAGKPVVLITNSPRLSQGVHRQLDQIGLSRQAYDFVVTSGDVTRALIAEADSKVFHLGPERDLDLFEGLDVALCGEQEAATIVATGFFDDETETPDDYADMLRGLAGRGLPMICANPDVVVQRGDRRIWCAGSLARAYQELGGEVRIAGKPYRPIYELAAQRVGGIADKRVLAIGDGLATDIKGAQTFGLDALLILAGIHADDIEASTESVAQALREADLTARYFMPVLR